MTFTKNKTDLRDILPQPKESERQYYVAVVSGWYPKSSDYSLNARKHWAARKRLTDDAHERVGWALRDAVGKNRWPCGWPMVGSVACGRWTITLTVCQRKGRCPDGDNLQGSLKGVRDACAKDLGIDDGSPNVEWRYVWQRGADGVLIELEEAS